MRKFLPQRRWGAEVTHGAVIEDIQRGVMWGVQKALFTTAAIATVCTMFYVAFQFFSG